MHISSTLCREQEAVQRQRAATALLENVRLVAERAAAAWRVEAEAAEHREKRQARLAGALGVEQTQDQRNAWSSENPDRGLAQPTQVA